MALVKSTLTVASFTMLSRITGFARDMLMANLIGAGALSDAWSVAFKLPNFFRRIFAEGAFSAAFIPSFASIMTAEGRKQAVDFAGEVMSVLFVALLVLNAVFIAFMPTVTHIFAPGFTANPEKFDLTIAISRITFPYILFISLVSLLGSVLNSMGKFAAPAASPILLNLCMIAGMTWLTHTPTPVHALAISVCVAGVVQLVWLVAICIRHDCMPGLYLPRLTPQVKAMLALMAPAVLGSSVQQLNLLIDTIIGSTLADGSVSYLYYADRVNELPIGVIGVAIGTVLLPTLSRHIKAGETQKAHHEMNRALELVLLFGIPATAALLLMAEPIIRVLYFHGKFAPEAVTACASALVAFSTGLPAYLTVKVFAPGFYANHDTKTPFKIALLCVGVNLFFNLTLIHHFQHVGMAMATAIASWVNVALMARILHKRGIFVPDALLKKRLLKMTASAKVMGLTLYMVGLVAAPFYLEGMYMRTLALLVVIGIGMAVYASSILSLKAYDAALLRNLLLKKSRKA